MVGMPPCLETTPAGKTVVLPFLFGFSLLETGKNQGFPSFAQENDGFPGVLHGGCLRFCGSLKSQNGKKHREAPVFWLLLPKPGMAV